MHHQNAAYATSQASEPMTEGSLTEGKDNRRRKQKEVRNPAGAQLIPTRSKSPAPAGHNKNTSATRVV
jgi:hypothetical protein